MNNKNYYKSIVLFLTLPLIIINFGFQQQITAQSNSQRVNKNRVVFKPPKDAKPKVTVGGASRDRGKCPEDPNDLNPYVTPLIPARYQGLTTQAHPTILVYLPNTSVQKAFFSLTEIGSTQNIQSHYQTLLPLPQKPGIVSIELPKNAPELEIGKIYKWSFVILCNNRLRPDSPLVEGIIERVALNSTLSEQLKTAKKLEKVALYGQAGLWYDTISTLWQMRYADPKNSELTTIWQELLNSESVELNAIADQPLIQ